MNYLTRRLMGCGAVLVIAALFGIKRHGELWASRA